MTYKLMIADKNRSRLRGFKLLEDAISNVQFKNGIRVEEGGELQDTEQMAVHQIDYSSSLEMTHSTSHLKNHAPSKKEKVFQAIGCRSKYLS